MGGSLLYCTEYLVSVHTANSWETIVASNARLMNPFVGHAAIESSSFQTIL